MRSTGTSHKKSHKKTRKQVGINKDDVDTTEKIIKTIRITEFASTEELSSLMDTPVNEVIAKCMSSLNIFVSINQRLDKDTITLIADEFNHNVEYSSIDEESDDIAEIVDGDEERPPIVTVMGHVNHGKTSLLDNIRSSKVAEKESGGITQHIGAYKVKSKDKNIVFLDTPGHKDFTAMRARGSKITDIAVIVVAADDSVKNETIEALNHASVAGVAIIFAINKIDRPNANVEKVKQDLGNLNYLVEDWGGKYQSYEISAKTGKGIDKLLEGILVEAELLELKTSSNTLAKGTVIESSLDKGKGYVTTLLVQHGTLKIGDIILVGEFYSKNKSYA